MARTSRWGAKLVITPEVTSRSTWAWAVPRATPARRETSSIPIRDPSDSTRRTPQSTASRGSATGGLYRPQLSPEQAVRTVRGPGPSLDHIAQTNLDMLTDPANRRPLD